MTWSLPNKTFPIVVGLQCLMKIFSTNDASKINWIVEVAVLMAAETAFLF